MRKMYYEDFKEGEVYEGSQITMTEAHIVTFAGLTGDYNPLHLSSQYAGTTMFKERIAHGILTYSIVVGQLLHPLVETTVVANVGISAQFTAPVRIGDTLNPSCEIIKKEPKKNNGLVRFQISSKNQNGEDVLSGEIGLLLKYKEQNKK